MQNKKIKLQNFEFSTSLVTFENKSVEETVMNKLMVFDEYLTNNRLSEALAQISFDQGQFKRSLKAEEISEKEYFNMRRVYSDILLEIYYRATLSEDWK